MLCFFDKIIPQGVGDLSNVFPVSGQIGPFFQGKLTLDEVIIIVFGRVRVGLVFIIIKAQGDDIKILPRNLTHLVQGLGHIRLEKSAHGRTREKDPVVSG